MFDDFFQILIKKMNGILKDSFQVIPIFPVGRAGSLFVQSIFDDNKDFLLFQLLIQYIAVF